MRLKYFIVNLVIGYGLCMFVNGCAHHQDHGDFAVVQYGNEFSSNQYSKAISRLEQTARLHPDVSKRSGAHLELAYLYASYKNPKRDYKKALVHLEIYASLYPPFANDQNLRNWLSVLKEMNRQSKKIALQNKEIRQLAGRLEKLSQKNEALTESNKRLISDNSAYKNKNVKLIQSNTRLKDANTELAETIEMLKNIDRHVEEKRRAYNENQTP